MKIYKKSFYLIFSLLVLVFILAFSLSFYIKKSQSPRSTKIPSATPTLTATPSTSLRQKAKVIKIIDGDSIVLDDGREVRYIGINTPELPNKYNNFATEECFARQAKDTNDALVLNQEVELESDINDKDQYGRLLRYVYSDGVLVNEFLVEWGFAKVETSYPEKRYFNLFETAQSQARSQKRGLWGKCN